MEKKAILTDHAPKPIGPYSQAIQAGPWVFCSGQIALDPKTGALSGSDVESQAKQVLENLKAVLTAAGCAFENVVKTTIFLKSMNDFPKVNEIYGKYFTGVTPARSTVEVSRLPRDVVVEIEAVAFKG
ncbi:MAG: RidA family protein [Bdellovibrionales bacterium]|nr:RidA family protein [Bdellovibrionales bacterium]